MLRKVSVNSELVKQVVRIGNHKTEEEAATKALECYIGCLERQKIDGASGTSGFNLDFDGK